MRKFALLMVAAFATISSFGAFNCKVVVPAGDLGESRAATVTYSNGGSSAIAAPYVRVEAGDNAFVRFSETDAWSKSVEFLATSDKLPASSLQAGETVNIPVFVYTDTEEAQLALSYTQSSAEAFPWSDIGSSLKPSYVEDSAWTFALATLKSRFGTTWNSYLSCLRANADYLAENGRPVRRLDSLLQIEINHALGVDAALPVLASVTDAARSARGMGLSFTRSYSSAMYGRFTIGILGYGWTDNLSTCAELSADGETLVFRVPGGGSYSFTKVTGSWKPEDARDKTVLGESTDAYTLTYQSGTVQTFAKSNKRISSIADNCDNKLTFTWNGNTLQEVAHTDGQTLTFSYSGGLLSSVTDDCGRQTTYTYSGSLLTKVTASDGLVTSYEYRSADGTAAACALSRIVYPDGTTREFSYDTSSGLVSAISSNGGKEKTMISRDGGVITLTGPDGAETTIKTGVSGEVLETVDALGGISTNEYTEDGLLESVVSPSGLSGRIEHDALGRVSESVSAAGTTTVFAYEETFGNLKTVTDAKNHAVTYGYDAKGRGTSVTFVDGSASTLEYNDRGDVVKSTNRRGQTIVYSYYDNGLLKEKIWSNGRTFTYGYDVYGNVTTATDSETGTVTMRYDDADRLTRIEYPTGRGFTFDYDSCGRLEKRTSLDGAVEKFAYDASGRLASVKDDSGNAYLQNIYDETTGRLLKQVNGNGTSASYLYDRLGRVVSIEHCDADGKIAESLQYCYDADGRCIRAASLLGEERYAYDNDGQLTAVEYSGGMRESFAYDAVGNRTTANGATYNVNAMNQYTSVSGGASPVSAITYDDDGNMTSLTDANGKTSYYYDTLNRLVAVTNAAAGIRWSCSYDVFGNRVSVTDNDVTTERTYLQGSLPSVAAEYVNGQLKERHIVVGAVRIADIAGTTGVSPVDSESTRYYHADLIGSTRLVTDGNGSIVDRRAYKAFGETRVGNETTSSAGYVGTLGVETDPTGLLFMRNRYYSPAIGRFIQMDPIGLEGEDVNLYRYCENCVESSVDPMGLFLRAVCTQAILPNGGGIPRTCLDVNIHHLSNSEMNRKARNNKPNMMVEGLFTGSKSDGVHYDIYINQQLSQKARVSAAQHEAMHAVIHEFYPEKSAFANEFYAQIAGGETPARAAANIIKYYKNIDVPQVISDEMRRRGVVRMLIVPISASGGDSSSGEGGSGDNPDPDPTPDPDPDPDPDPTPDPDPDPTPTPDPSDGAIKSQDDWLMISADWGGDSATYSIGANIKLDLRRERGALYTLDGELFRLADNGEKVENIWRTWNPPVSDWVDGHYSGEDIYKGAPSHLSYPRADSDVFDYVKVLVYDRCAIKGFSGMVEGNGWTIKTASPSIALYPSAVGAHFKKVEFSDVLMKTVSGCVFEDVIFSDGTCIEKASDCVFSNVVFMGKACVESAGDCKFINAKLNNENAVKFATGCVFEDSSFNCGGINSKQCQFANVAFGNSSETTRGNADGCKFTFCSAANVTAPIFTAVTNCRFEGSVGAIATRAESCTFEGCSVSSSVCGTFCVGGVVGTANDCEFVDCVGDVHVVVEKYINGQNAVGGFVGLANGCRFRGCSSSGSVVGIKCVGGLVGEAVNSSFENCSSSCLVKGSQMVGGLVGVLDDGTESTPCTVFNCMATGDVSGRGWTGGFVGSIENCKVTSCTATGDVLEDMAIAASSNSDDDFGGFVGHVSEGSTGGSLIELCKASGSVTALNAEDVGGFAGLILGNSIVQSTIRKCGATGNIIGGDNVGGFAGDASDCTVSDCYATGSVSAKGLNSQANAAGFIGEYVADCALVRCYASGSVTVADDVLLPSSGGLIPIDMPFPPELLEMYEAMGMLDSLIGSLLLASENCYWNKDTTGQNNSGTGTGLTAGQARLQSSYSGWDFSGTWNMGSAGPELKDVGANLSLSSVPKMAAVMAVSTEAEGEAKSGLFMSSALPLAAAGTGARPPRIYCYERYVAVNDFNYTFELSADDGATLSVSGLPAGFSFLNGMIYGRAEDIGSYNIAITAVSSEGETEKQVSFVVVEAPECFSEWVPANDLGFYILDDWTDPIVLTTDPFGTTCQTSFEYGDAIYLNYAFANIAGYVEVGNFVNRFTLSNGDSVDDSWFGYVLPAGKVGWIGYDFMPEFLNGLPPGDYTLTCTLNADGDLPESNVENNVASVSFEIKGPDLTVSSLSVSRETISLSESVVVNWRVDNNGTSGANKTKTAFMLYDYDSSDGSITLKTTEWIDCDSIAVGGGRNYTKTITGKSLGVGEYNIAIWTDAKFDAAESDESNNWRLVYIKVVEDSVAAPNSGVDWQFKALSGEPDSFFLSASSDMKKKATTFVVGQPIYMRCCWWNAKKGALYGSMKTSVFLNGVLGVFTNDRSYFEKNTSYHFTYTKFDFLQNLPVGNYTLTAVLDSENSWRETDEKNNVKIVTFTVVGNPTICSEETYRCALNVPVSWPVTFDGKGKVSGLPLGLTYSNGAISGKATKVGTYVVNVSASNDAGTASKTITIVVEDPGFTVVCSAKPNGASSRDVVSGDTIDMFAGVKQEIVLSATPGKVGVEKSDVSSMSVKGLPTGLKLSGGAISGVPTKPGSYLATITFKNKYGWTSDFDIRFVVSALPSWAVGSFEGAVGEGAATMSVTAAGKVAGKFALGGTNWTFKADSYAAVESLGATTNFSVSAVATAGKATMPVELALSGLAIDYLPASATARAAGTFGDAVAELYRLVWTDKGDADAASLATGYAGAYSFVAAYGDLEGGVTFTLNEKGAISGAAVLPDGAMTRKVTFAANALAEPDGLHVVVSLPPDAKKGYPTVFEDRVLVMHSEEGDDIHAYRDPGAIVGTGELNLGSGASGTVTVSPKYGQVAAGKTVTLTAKADKGSVFSCWEITTNGVPMTGLDLSSATLKYVPPASGDVTATAKFITVDEDKAAIKLSVDNGGWINPSASTALATNVTCGVALSWQLEASALSATTVKVAGLPAGLKFDAKSSAISGAPTAAKTSDVKITVTTAGKSSVVYLVKLTVDPLPAWAVGSFEGSAGEGSATMSVTAAGKVAGKFSFGGTTWTFKADSYAAVESLGATTNLYVSAVATAGKATMPVELSLSDLALGYLPASAASCAVGTFGDANAELYRLVWTDKGDADAASLAAGYAGAYSLVAAYGDTEGDVTFTLNEKGAVSGAAVLPDGAKTRKVTFAANALAEPDGLHVVVALPPDAKKGYPAVFEDRVLMPWSGVADDDFAYRDPGAIVGTGELNLGSGASGTVTVSPKYGQVAAGKPVTLTAKADKGSVFSCWEIVGVDTTGLDLSSATLKYVSPASGDVTATAKFVTVEEDIASLTLALPDAAAASDGTCDVDLGACVESLSIPKLTVSGLPAGLKYDAKTMKITGKATKPGVYTVTVKATNTSATGKDAKTATFKITVPNFECEALPNLDPATNAYGILTAGVAISADLVDCTPADGWTVKVAGLPAGLKYDTKTGKITGTPTAKAGSYTVTFTASKKGEPNQMATITLNVEPLPDWVVGTFNGGSDVWQSIITVGANGKISGKYLQTFNYTFTFTSPGFDKVEYVSEDVDPEWNGWKYSAVVTAKSSAAMERYTLEIYNGALGGKARLLDNIDYTGPYTLTSAYLFQAVDWKSEPWKSFAAVFSKNIVEYEFVDRNDNPVVLELKFSATGAVAVKGLYYVWDSKTGTYVKQSATGSATLIPTAYSPGDNAFRARVYVVLPKALTGGCGKCVKLIWDGAAGAWSVDLQT